MERPFKRYEKSLLAISGFLGVESGSGDVVITGLTQSSQDIEPGDIFLAFAGARTHGARYCKDARERGACAVLTDITGAAIIAELGIELPTIIVKEPRSAAGTLCAWFYDQPMRDLYGVGITGTNGKTTTTTLLHQIWMQAGKESGLIGTVGTRIGTDFLKTARTTPESADLHALIAAMKERHVRNFAMEVSSHAISLDRIRGSHFAAVAFTNLTQDHLDFHSSMEEYFGAKASLFSFEYADLGFINIDDPYGARLAASTQIPIRTLSRSNPRADWSYSSAISHMRGNDVCIRGLGGILIEGKLPLHGSYNLDNALMAVALAFESGVDPIEIAAILPTLTGAPGRLEPIDIGQDFKAFVDYAHSPDAVARVLETCRSLTQGRVIAVLGCGGDRDISKRSLMGQALAEGSDIAVFTSDNPRSEDPMKILDQMIQGVNMSTSDRVIPDRKIAIEYAVSLASAGDVVVILGKGHETGQEKNGVITPFDDSLVLAEAIERRA